MGLMYYLGCLAQTEGKILFFVFLKKKIGMMAGTMFIDA
jgi:hypothetical protein